MKILTAPTNPGLSAYQDDFGWLSGEIAFSWSCDCGRPSCMRHFFSGVESGKTFPYAEVTERHDLNFSLLVDAFVREAKRSQLPPDYDEGALYSLAEDSVTSLEESIQRLEIGTIVQRVPGGLAIHDLHEAA